MSTVPLMHSVYANSLNSDFHSPSTVQPLDNLQICSLNEPLCASLGLSTDGKDWLAYLKGDIWPGSTPIAMCYAGHQFGNWVPRLGDGRGVLLGELADKNEQLWEVHCKGSGPTPYSRGFDGRALVRSSVREHLVSEAMFALGIPTTRSLGLFTSDSFVQREGQERAGMLLRVARSHIRFGHFEWARSVGGHESVRQLAEFVIDHYYKELILPGKSAADVPTSSMFMRVVKETAETVALWYSFGFCHGVMNTDNMSILGDTIDYGPYGFMDTYTPRYTPNTSDERGRYSFQAQAQIGLWNLRALFSALVDTIAHEMELEPVDKTGNLHPEIAQLITQMQEEYSHTFWAKYTESMLHRLGISKKIPLAEGRVFIEDLMKIFATNELDYNYTFAQLSLLDTTEDLAKRAGAILEGPGEATTGNTEISALIQAWTNTWKGMVDAEDEGQWHRQMRAKNPLYTLRNYFAQLAITNALQGGDLVSRYTQVLQNPMHLSDAVPESFMQPPPKNACSISLSCSS